MAKKHAPQDEPKGKKDKSEKPKGKPDKSDKQSKKGKHAKKTKSAKAPKISEAVAQSAVSTPVRRLPSPKPAVRQVLAEPSMVAYDTDNDLLENRSDDPDIWRTADEIGRTALGPRPVPPLQGGARFDDPELATATLASGLTVYAIRKAGTPMVELRLRVPFGGRARSHAARAEMLAATVLLGTSSRTRDQLDAELALVGGHLDASVDPQRLLVSGSVLSHGFGDVLTVLADSLTDPAFRRKDVQGERDRLVEHLAVMAAQPASVARRHLQERRFGDTPAAWEIPDAALVAAVTPSQIATLHAKAVVPEGSFLVVVGDLDPQRALDLVAERLGGWAPVGRAQPLQTPPTVTPGAVHAFAREGAVQSQVRLSAAGLTREDPQYAAFQLANLVYGGYFSSRLVENIREDKGYVYGAHSTIEFWPGRAALTIAFDTATESTAPALWETRYELGRIALTPPGPAEVESARNYALGTLATSLATQAGYASTLSALLGQGIGIDWLRGHPERLAAATAEEVAAAAGQYLTPAAFTGVVVGDLAAVGPGLAAIGGVELL